MRVLFDTNVVLDVLLARRPHVTWAAQLFEHVASRRLDGLLGATTITTIHYLAAKATEASAAARHAGTLLSLFEVAPVGRPVLEGALRLGFADFADAVLHEAARLAGATGIVTRDRAGFAKGMLTIYEPRELVMLLGTPSSPEAPPT